MILMTVILTEALWTLYRSYYDVKRTDESKGGLTLKVQNKLIISVFGCKYPGEIFET